MIDVATLDVSYVTGLMNICMAVAVNPASREVAVVGTDALNQIRFESNLSGRFLRVNFALVSEQGTAQLRDLNPHLTYATPNVALSERERSIGDPRGVAWNADGSRLYVTGMGSNNVVAVDAEGVRAGLAPIQVGEGPTGIVLDEARDRGYVLNKFGASISIVSLSGAVEIAKVPFFDPSPAALKSGRKHLYDTQTTSGLGHVACGSCHVDARMDRLSWDLGQPEGSMKSPTGQNLGMGVINSGFQNWHPMKGPMATQTLQDIIGKEPHHWRGDRSGLEEFNPAFVGLQGDDATLTADEMQEFEDFLATIYVSAQSLPQLRQHASNIPAAPGTLHDRAILAGRSAARHRQRPARACALPPAAASRLELPQLRHVPHAANRARRRRTIHQLAICVPLPIGPNGEHHHGLVSVDGHTNVTMKIPQLRNLYKKVGFETTQLSNRSGFGFRHDGSVDSLARFVSGPVFAPQSDQEVADLVAFMLSFSGSDLPAGSATNVQEPTGTASKDSHAAVGKQATLGGTAFVRASGLLDAREGARGRGSSGPRREGRTGRRRARLHVRRRKQFPVGPRRRGRDGPGASGCGGNRERAYVHARAERNRAANRNRRG